MKRLITIMLAMLFAFSSVACAQELATNINTATTWPVANEKISVSIAAIPNSGSTNEDPDNLWQISYWDEVSNLDIDCTIIPASSAKEKLQLMMTTGDFPDALCYPQFTTEQLSQYAVDEQMFYPIDELLPYMPNFSALLEERSDYRATITAPDGHIYGIPCFADGSYPCPTRFFFNVDWLAALNMEIPTTLDEFYDVLVAFKNTDLNGNGAADEIAFSGSWDEGMSERDWMFGTFGIATAYSDNIGLDYNGDEAKVVFAPRTESYREFLTFMNKLWNEGLLDPDMFTQTETQYGARILEDRVGFGGMSAPFVMYATKPEAYESGYPFAKEEGAKQIYADRAAVVEVGHVLINSECDLEAAAAIANLFDSLLTPEEYMMVRYGLEKGAEYPGEYDKAYGFWYDTENDVLVYDLPEGIGEWNWKIDMLGLWELPGYVGNGSDALEMEYAKAYPDSTLGQYLKDGPRYQDWMIPVIERCYPYVVDAIPDFLMTIEDLETVNELVTPLDDYVESMEAKFITGVEPLENIDEFWATLDELGVEEYTAVFEKYYDNYKALLG